MIAVDTGTREELEEFAALDPAVLSGLLNFEVKTCLRKRGNFAKRSLHILRSYLILVQTVPNESVNESLPGS